MSEGTKLDNISKDDPNLEQKTSELLAARLEEEKRKAELRQEQKMQKAREDARLKKENSAIASTVEKAPILTQPEPLKNVKVAEPPSAPVVKESGEYITRAEFEETKQKINRSFEWLEKYIKEQTDKNTRFENFVTVLSKACEQFKK
jgi:hypothetical protein